MGRRPGNKTGHEEEQDVGGGEDTELTKAVVDRDLERMRRLLRKGASANERNAKVACNLLPLRISPLLYTAAALVVFAVAVATAVNLKWVLILPLSPGFQHPPDGVRRLRLSAGPVPAAAQGRQDPQADPGPAGHARARRVAGAALRGGRRVEGVRQVAHRSRGRPECQDGQRWVKEREKSSKQEHLP